MAKKQIEKTQLVDSISNMEMSKVFDENFTRYAFKVLEDRALPDARDGLKPSQRRVLVTMNDLKLGPNTKHAKCSKITGNTMANYHPHGDAVIYPTLVNMATQWSMRHPLIDPQGNFGSVDGDSPASVRYTEARMSQFGKLLIDDVSEDVVDHIPSYNEEHMEPKVLPCAYPNLLVNGSSGIAVGWATNIPSHNLKELALVIEKLVENPNLTVKEVIKIMPGPDFPSGGKLLGQEEVLEYYETGKGSLKLEGLYDIETPNKGNESIVITEFPEGGSPEKFREQLENLVDTQKISGIADCMNFTSYNEGIKVVVEIAKNGNTKLVLNQLLKHTCLRTSFGVNNTVLVDKKLIDKSPIINLVQIFIDHRKEVLTRKYNAELKKNNYRIEILDGLIAVSSKIDEAIKIIRASDNPEDAQKNLLSNKIVKTENQAKAVIAITLGKLTKLEQSTLKNEKTELETRNIYLIKTLSNNNDILALIVKETKEIADKYGTDRKTKIGNSGKNIEVEDLIKEEQVIVTITTDDCIKRVSSSQYSQQNKGGKGTKSGNLKDEIYMKDVFSASTHDDLLVFTDSGRVFSLRVFELPEMDRTAKGRPIINFIDLRDGEKACSYLPLKDIENLNTYLTFVSKNGTVKKTSIKEYANINKSGIIAVTVREGDKIVNVMETSGSDDIMLASAKGNAVRFAEEEVSSVGRNGVGVRGMKIDDDDFIIGGVNIKMIKEEKCTMTENPKLSLLTITSNGYGKRTNVDEYRVQNEDGCYRSQSRAGKGRINIDINKKNGQPVSIMLLHGEEDIAVITKEGKIIRLASSEIRTMGRNTTGTRLITLKDNDSLIKACPIIQEENSEEEIHLQAS